MPPFAFWAELERCSSPFGACLTANLTEFGGASLDAWRRLGWLSPFWLRRSGFSTKKPSLSSFWRLEESEESLSLLLQQGAQQGSPEGPVDEREAEEGHNVKIANNVDIKNLLFCD